MCKILCVYAMLIFYSQNGYVQLYVYNNTPLYTYMQSHVQWMHSHTICVIMSILIIIDEKLNTPHTQIITRLVNNFTLINLSLVYTNLLHILFDGFQSALYCIVLYIS